METSGQFTTRQRVEKINKSASGLERSLARFTSRPASIKLAAQINQVFSSPSPSDESSLQNARLLEMIVEKAGEGFRFQYPILNQSLKSKRMRRSADRQRRVAN
jgi:hypothetical protein